MTNIDTVKNRLIDKILVSKNEQLLLAIENIFASTQKDEVISFSSEQLELLMMSEQDIKDGKLISESDLDKFDEEWLN